MVSFEGIALRNIKMKLAYDGGYFNGWQRHSFKDNSVEDILSNAIEEIIGERVILIAASRTDKGVHACEQIINFRTLSQISISELKSKLRNRLNFIYVLSVEEVSTFFHSRLHSIGKKYVYQIWNDESIENIYKPYCWHLKKKLNLELMRDYSSLFIGKKDFKKFSRDRSAKNTIKTIFQIKIRNFKQLILIEITGDSFLYNMVRCIVANLVFLTYGKLKVEDLMSGQSGFFLAPPEGLFLERVYY